MARRQGDEDPPRTDLPQVDREALRPVDPDAFAAPGDPRHPPRILVLHGSLRATSYSRALAEEAGRLLEWFGCEVRHFRPHGLPLPDTPVEGGEPADHPKVRELRDLASWSEGMMWVSPERLVDVCEELVRFIWLTRGRAAALVDRYSERKESREASSRRVNQASL